MDSSSRRPALAIIICLLFTQIAYGQEINNERLLNLYFKANQAREADSLHVAVATYLEIAESYPSSPEPYLHLGNIYSMDEEDKPLLEKALACYRRYLELAPEAEDREATEQRITILEEKLKPAEEARQARDTLVFTYTPIAEELKATNPELMELFNITAKESENSTVALNDLGCLYANGIGTKKNPLIAAVLFAEAAEKENLMAKLNLAESYRNGFGVEKNYSKAMELYKEAFEEGYSDAMVFCGDICLDSIPDNETRYKAAMEYYQKAIFRRSPLAYLRMGELHKDGLGVEKDLNKAWEYYQKSLSSQQAEFLTEVGILYAKGIVVLPDRTKALEYLRKAAVKGSSKAMLELSELHRTGQGADFNPKTAREWYDMGMQEADRALTGYNSIKSKVHAILSKHN